MNAAISAAFTAVETSASPGVLNTSPYKAVGPYFPVTAYYDSNGGGTKDGSESDIQKGRYNNIGGVLKMMLSLIVNSGKLREGTAGRLFLNTLIRIGFS